MKKFSIALFLMSIITSNYYSQTRGWLHSDRKKFEELYPLLGSFIDSVKVYPTKSFYHVLTEDTLSIGKWSGNYIDIINFTFPQSYDITISITQTKPYIKGTAFLVNSETKIQDTIHALVVGKDSADIIRLILCYNKGLSYGYRFDFLEGKAYTIKYVSNDTQKIFAGLSESGFGKNPSKLGFAFRKEK
jgi:hypothetical protein